MGIFKAYDIRGLVPSELDPELARKIGNAFARLLDARRLIIGRDVRTHSPAIADAVIEGEPVDEPEPEASDDGATRKRKKKISFV